MSLADALRDPAVRAAVVDELLRDPAMQRAAVEALRDPAWAAEALASQRALLPAEGTMVELGYAARDAASGNLTVSATSAATAQAVLGSDLVVRCDGSPVVVEFSAYGGTAGPNAGGTGLLCNLWIDGADVGRIAFVGTSTANVEVSAPLKGLTRIVPAAGSHTFNVKAYRLNANGIIYNGAGAAADAATPAFVRVTKVAPTPRVG